MITPEGAEVVAQILAGLSQDSLVGGSMVVYDGEGGGSSSPFDEGFPTVDGGKIVFQSTFVEGQANFEWTHRRMETAQGVEFDHEREDLGRKAPGSVWTLQAILALDSALAPENHT